MIAGNGDAVAAGSANACVGLVSGGLTLAEADTLSSDGERYIECPSYEKAYCPGGYSSWSFSATPDCEGCYSWYWRECCEEKTVEFAVHDLSTENNITHYFWVSGCGNVTASDKCNFTGETSSWVSSCPSGCSPLVPLECVKADNPSTCRVVKTQEGL